MNNRIEIAISKKKVLFNLLLAMGFVLAGILFTANPEAFKSPVFSNTYFIRFAGLIAFLFFGLCLVVIVRKFLDKQPGLTIDEEGILDNTSGVSIGLIKWEDIVGIKTVTVFNQKFLMIEVRNPEAYIEKAKSRLSKKAMEKNLKMYGSPISIISNSLTYDFKKLEDLLQREFEKRKK